MEQENRRRKGRSTFLLFSSPTVQRRNSMTEMKQFIIVHNIILRYNALACIYLYTHLHTRVQTALLTFGQRCSIHKKQSTHGKAKCYYFRTARKWYTAHRVRLLWLRFRSRWKIATLVPFFALLLRQKSIDASFVGLRTSSGNLCCLPKRHQFTTLCTKKKCATPRK